MRWWMDFGQTESFATYMASVAIERTKLFPGAPQAFFSGMKRWAYGEDQLPDDPFIELSVPDTDQGLRISMGSPATQGVGALKTAPLAHRR